jgi:hypothetical protein
MRSQIPIIVKYGATPRILSAFCFLKRNKSKIVIRVKINEND